MLGSANAGAGHVGLMMLVIAEVQIGEVQRIVDWLKWRSIPALNSA